VKTGDKVKFTNQVVRQCGHDKTVTDMRGVVNSVNRK
jgi:hypothetical protein